MAWLKSCRWCGEDYDYGDSCTSCYNSPERKRARRRYLRAHGFDEHRRRLPTEEMLEWRLARRILGEADGSGDVVPTPVNASPPAGSPTSENSSPPAAAEVEAPALESSAAASPRPAHPSATAAKAFLDAAKGSTFAMLAALESSPPTSIKLVIVQKEADGTPVQIATAQVFQVPEIGAHLFLDRAPNDRLPIMYRVSDVNHILVANTPSPRQGVVAFVQPVESRPIP